jgi:phage/plasmid primase-like uncharacterized protein
MSVNCHLFRRAHSSIRAEVDVDRAVGILPHVLVGVEARPGKTADQAEQERFEATTARLSDEFRSLPSGVKKTSYHESKGIEPLPGARVRNGDVLVPGYDVGGKCWTVQYIKEDGHNGLQKIPGNMVVFT